MAMAVRLTPEESIKMMKDYLEEFRELKPWVCHKYNLFIKHNIQL